MGFFDRLGNLGKGTLAIWRKGERHERVSRETLEEELRRLEGRQRASRADLKERSGPATEPDELAEPSASSTPVIEPDPDTGLFPERKKTL